MSARIASLRTFTLALGAVGAAWAAPLCASAQPAPAEGDWMLDARLRYEGVSQDGFTDADALTLRVRLGYETPAWRGLRALGEAEGVAHAIDDFNDTVNGKTAFAVVPDPDGIEVNRLQVSWTGQEGRRAVAGRQRIVLGDARFIGNVGFRQNEQTFDAFRLEARPFARAALTYIYIDNVRRIFGEDSPQGVWRSDSHVVQADLDVQGLGRISMYGLLLDFQNAPANASQTYVARWSRQWDVGAAHPRLTLAAAHQSDFRGDGVDFDAAYQHAEFSFRREPVALTLGAERLEGDGVRAFATPLATLHAFQGWADAFLATPPDGVRDLYAGVWYDTPPWPAARPVTLAIMAHDFADGDGGADFGQELDALARFTLTPRAALEATAAFFDGDDPRFADRTKVWLALEYKL